MEFKPNHKRQTSFIVIDNFYEDPFGMREFALSLEYAADNKYFKGKRSYGKHLTNQIKESFEIALNSPISKWDYDVNGCFQYCQPEDLNVYHMDNQKWAAIVYLTPSAPPECGTSFYKSKKTGIRRCPNKDEVETEEANQLLESTFQGGFYDKSQFELIDTVGNVFNRLVLWDARMIHAASQYFGNSKETARLFQIFFFDTED